MSEKKQLDEKELENITGGVDTTNDFPSVSNPINKYDLSSHFGENLYFISKDYYVYGRLEKYEKRDSCKVYVIKTNCPDYQENVGNQSIFLGSYTPYLNGSFD